MGGGELLVILAIILLLFGANRLPKLGRSLGSGIREFRQGFASVHDDKDEMPGSKKEQQEARQGNGAHDQP